MNLDVIDLNNSDLNSNEFFLDDSDSENNTKGLDSFKLNDLDDISSNNLVIEDIDKKSYESNNKNDSLLEGGGSKEDLEGLDADALFNNLNDNMVESNNNNNNNNNNSEFVDPNDVFDKIDEEISKTKLEDNNSNEESNNGDDLNDNVEDNSLFEDNDPDREDNKPDGEDNELDGEDNDLDGEDNDLDEAFITDDESTNEENNFNIEFINSEPLKFKETHYLSDDKFIVNERQQRDDLLNEMMNTLPEKYRNTDYFKNKTLSKLLHKVKLKNKYSKYDQDGENIGLYQLGDFHKSHLEHYSNNIFNSKYLIPIVKEKKKIFRNTLLEHENDLGSPDTELNYINSNYFNEISSFNKIKNKFKKGAASREYQYISEQAEISELLRSYIPVGNTKKAKHDFTVVRDCFKNCSSYHEDGIQEIDLDEHIVLGPTNRFTSIHQDELREEDEFNISGYLTLPSNILNNDLINNKYILSDFINHSPNFVGLKDNIKEYGMYLERVNLDLSEGDKVKVCFSEFNTNLEILGTLISINDANYSVKPDDEDIRGILHINPEDENVSISKDYTIKNIATETKQCYNEVKDKFGIYLLPEEELSHLDKKKLLNYILPTNNEILQSHKENFKTVKNFSDLDKLLSKFSINLDELTYNNISFIIDSLKEKSDSVETLSKVEEREFQTFLENPPRKVNRTEVDLIGNKLLSVMEKYYGRYPFWDFYSDNDQLRLDWILKQPDSGTLFFKMIVKGKLEKTQESKDKTIRRYEDDSRKYHETLDKINTDIDGRKLEIEGTSSCEKNVLAKVYSNISDLEKDNGREITFDSNLTQGIGTNIVQSGHYAILKQNGIHKLYKRITPADGEQLWVLESKKLLDQLSETRKDFCLAQGKPLKEMNFDTIDQPSQCDFSVQDKICQDKKIVKLENEKKEIESLVEKKHEAIQFLKVAESSIKRLGEDIVFLEKYIKSSKRQKKIKTIPVLAYNLVDPKYQGIYDKIDRYKIQISKLIDSQKYQHLDILVKKLGREEVLEQENENYVYCKYGEKKVLCCRHDLDIIKYYKSEEEEREEIMVSLLEKYGDDFGGTWRCKFCGVELGIAEYETTEQFTKTGARAVEHEEMESDNILTSEYATTQILDQLKDVIIEEQKLEDDEFNILKIIYDITSVLGVKLTDDDILLVRDRSKADINNEVPIKDLWLSSQLSEDSSESEIKKITEKYEKLVNIISISWTTVNLFLLLQYSVPEYVLNKKHPKCNPSLDGYPLSEATSEDPQDLEGLDYFNCVLSWLTKTGGIWKSLGKQKKVNLTPKFIDIIKDKLKDHYYISMYDKKKDFLRSIKPEELEKYVYAEWKEFRPPLGDIPEIHDLEDINTLDIVSKLLNSEIPKSNIDGMKANYKEYLLFNSLELIRLQNDYINKARIENIKYHPTPLDNSCCLTEIKNYNFYNYFSELEGGNIEQLKTLLNQKAEIHETVIESPHRSSYSVQSRYIYKKLENVSKLIFTPITDITNDDITKLHLKYISSGSNIGQLHIYDNDGICLVTNEKKTDIQSKTYTQMDYIELMENIISSRRLQITDYNYNRQNTIDMIDGLIEKNNFLRQNIKFSTEYEESWIQKLRAADSEYTEELWDELDILNSVEKTKIIEDMVDTLNLRGNDRDTLEHTLKNFGVFTNINNENEDTYYEKDYEFFETDEGLSSKIRDNLNYKNKSEYIKYCIGFMKKFLSRALHNTSDRADSVSSNLRVPKNWNIENSQYDRLVGLISANLKLTNSINNIDYEQILRVYNIVNEFSIGVEKLNGMSDIYQCGVKTDTPENNSRIRKELSDYTHKNNSILLECMFINIILEILNLVDRPLKEDSDPTDVEPQRVKANINMYKIVNELLKNMNPDNFILNEFSKNTIDKKIKTNNEKLKEDNLQFIAELDKEARQALMARVKTGAIGYKDLAKNLRSEMLGDPSLDEGHQIHNRAREALGEEASMEDIEAWISSNREEVEANQEIIDGYLLDDEEDGGADAFNYE